MAIQQHRAQTGPNLSTLSYILLHFRGARFSSWTTRRYTLATIHYWPQRSERHISEPLLGASMPTYKASRVPSGIMVSSARKTHSIDLTSELPTTTWTSRPTSKRQPRKSAETPYHHLRRTDPTCKGRSLAPGLVVPRLPSKRPVQRPLCLHFSAGKAKPPTRSRGMPLARSR